MNLLQKPAMDDKLKPAVTPVPATPPIPQPPQVSTPSPFVVDEESQAPAPPRRATPPLTPTTVEQKSESASAPPNQPEPSANLPPAPTPTFSAASAMGTQDVQPPAMGQGEVIPPVITPPQKSRKKLVAGVLAVLMMITAVVGGTLYIGRSTELRERAAVGESCTDNPVTPPAGFKWTALCEQSCTTNDDCPAGDENRADRGAWCYGFEDGKHPRCLRLDQLPVQDTCTQDSPRQVCSIYACNVGGGDYVTGEGTCPDNKYCCRLDTSRLTPAPGGTTPAPGTTTPAPGTGDQTGGSGQGQCAEDPGPAPKSSDGKDIYSQGCAVVASFVSKWGKDAGKRWALEHDLETQCTGGVAKACDGQSLQTQPTNVIEAFIATGLAGSCKKWADEHNSSSSVNNCQGPSACKAVDVYKYPYNPGDKLTGNLDRKIKAGDPVKFCISGTVGSGTPEVNINGTGWQRTNETNSAGESCRQYDIPSDATSIRVEGRI